MQRLALSFPMSLGTFADYEQAQRAVDYLSDRQFPVENCMIVGTDLRQVERVTGRLTSGKVVTGGALSGMWLGLFVAAMFSLFSTQTTFASFASIVVMGGVFGVVWALLGYTLTRGRRDFTSVSQVVATRYEVLVEHKLHVRGQELFAEMPNAPLSTTPPTPMQSAPPPSGQPVSAGPSSGPSAPLGAERPRPEFGEYLPQPGDPGQSAR